MPSSALNFRRFWGFCFGVESFGLRFGVGLGLEVSEGLGFRVCVTVWGFRVQGFRIWEKVLHSF